MDLIDKTTLLSKLPKILERADSSPKAEKGFAVFLGPYMLSSRFYTSEKGARTSLTGEYEIQMALGKFLYGKDNQYHITHSEIHTIIDRLFEIELLKVHSVYNIARIKENRVSFITEVLKDFGITASTINETTS